MREVSACNDEHDCYKSYEIALLSILYTVLTALYVTASTSLQYTFLGVITTILILNAF
jgi:hypothetical protein